MTRLSVAAAAICLLSLGSCRTLNDTGEEPVAFNQADFATADLDDNGQLSKTELAKHHHREALAEFDLDNDGKISASEWASARPSAGENDPHFNALDKDKDGTIGEDEAILFITEHVSYGNMFKELDENGDFNLHWEEIDAGEPSSLNVTLFSFHPDA